jgi:putative peptidoglycan lipid II flippase
MIRRIFSVVNKGWQGMHEAAILLGVFSLVSQLIGLFRDRVLANTIGPSSTLDIYYAAFRIPDLLYLSVASLASITVLMPFLIDRMNLDGKESARKFFSDIFSGFLILLVLVSAVVFVFMPQISKLIAPGFSPEELHTLIGVSRIMLLSPILLGLSSLVGTITQILRKFIVFSLSPIFYNLGIIFGIFVLYPHFGVYGLALGVVIGAALHLFIQIPTLISAGFTPRLTRHIEKASLSKLMTLSLPRTIGLSMNSISLLVIVALASTVGKGSVSIFNFAINLETTPVGIIGLSYAIASFPLLAETFAKGEMDKWQKSIFSATKQILFWSLPLTAMFIVLRAQIVRVVLGSGAFSWTDTKLTAACFAIFSIGMIGQSLVLISVRAFYSAHNTKTPLLINTISSLIIIGLAYFLLNLFNSSEGFREFIEALFRVQNTPGTAVLMLPLAYSIGTLLNAWLHWIDLRRVYIKVNGGVTRAFFQSLVSAFVLGVISYLVLNILAPIFGMHTFIGVFGQGAIAGLAGIFGSIIVLYLFKNEEFFELISAFRQKFWKTDLVDPDHVPSEN